MLLYYNRESRWTDSAATGVVSLLTSNGLVIVVIQIGFGIFRTVKYFANRKTKIPK
jgi:hypothetical protein